MKIEQTPNLDPETVLMGLSKYGLGLQLIHDGIFIEEKNLPKNRKVDLSKMKLGPFSKEETTRFVDRLNHIADSRDYKHFLSGVIIREVNLGHLHSGLRLAEHFSLPHQRFAHLYQIGISSKQSNEDSEEALIRARTMVDDIQEIKEKAIALACCALIDKKMGKDSLAFDGAEIAFKSFYENTFERIKPPLIQRKDMSQLMNLFLGDDEDLDESDIERNEYEDEEITSPDLIQSLRDVSLVGCRLASVSKELDKNPEIYLTISKVAASKIPTWSDFVSALSEIVRTEDNLGLDYTTSIKRIKEKITSDNNFNESVVEFWLDVVRLEKSVGADWQSSLDQVRALCEKMTDSPDKTMYVYTLLSEFELTNDLDPMASLETAKNAKDRLDKNPTGFHYWRSSEILEDVQEHWDAKQVLANPESLPTETEILDLVTQLTEYIDTTIDEVSKLTGDMRVSEYLNLAQAITEIGAIPVSVIDLAKYEVYSTRNQVTFARRLNILGKYQRIIGEQLHSDGYHILSQITAEDATGALNFIRDQNIYDSFALVGLGALLRPEVHQGIANYLDSQDPQKFKSRFNYGYSLIV